MNRLRKIAQVTCLLPIILADLILGLVGLLFEGAKWLWDRVHLLILFATASFWLALNGCASLPGKPPEPQQVQCSPQVASRDRTEPVIPDGAGIVQPVTPEARTATELFLNWLADFADWSHEADADRDKARDRCRDAETAKKVDFAHA